MCDWLLILFSLMALLPWLYRWGNKRKPTSGPTLARSDF